MKRELESAILLYHPDPKLSWHVESDASDNGIAGILFQIKDGERKIVSCTSRLLLERERRYGIFEKEVLAALWVIQKW